MSLKIKLLQAKMKLMTQKAHKFAQKIALAVVITEYLLAGAYAYTQNNGWLEFLEPKTVIIEISHAQEITEAPKTPAVEVSSVERIASTIYTLESSQGKNNYSKCEAIGQVNGIGYGIPGNGKYQCFENHAEEMETLKAWIEKHIAEGMTETELMCHYSGNNYAICK